MNKILIISLLNYLLIATANGQSAPEAQVVNTKLSEVTVSLNGATLHREASIDLQKGINLFKITGLSSSLDESSLKVGLSGDAKIVSISAMHDFITDSKKTKRAELIVDSLEININKLKKLIYDSITYQIEKKVLTENIGRIGKEGISISDLQITLPFYQTQLKKLHQEMIVNKKAIKQIKAIIEKNKLQLAEIHLSSQKQANTITVTVNAPTAQKTKLVLNYVSSQATWMPQYDIRTQGAGYPIVFDYKASIINRTGEDWEKILLKLTTADPSKLMAKPSLEVWGLHYDDESSYSNKQEGYLNNYQIQQNKSQQEYKGKQNAKNQEQIQETTQVEVNEVSVEFTVKDISTIESDGVPQLLDVNVFEFPASYQYYCVPKIDKDVYLMATITDWESMNLIEGVANIYLNNIFVGKSVIDIKSANDSLQFFLGIDKKVQVNKVKKKDESSKKTIGLNKKESFIYHINIRNSNKVPIDIEVIDQVPVSQDKDIAVTVDEVSKAEQDALSGKLTWHLNVPPSETQKLILEFSVKYSRGRKLNIRQSRKQFAPANFW